MAIRKTGQASEAEQAACRRAELIRGLKTLIEAARFGVAPDTAQLVALLSAAPADVAARARLALAKIDLTITDALTAAESFQRERAARSVQLWPTKQERYTDA